MKEMSRTKNLIALLGTVLLLALLLPWIAAALEVELAEYKPPSAGILGPG